MVLWWTAFKQKAAKTCYCTRETKRNGVENWGAETFVMRLTRKRQNTYVELYKYKNKN